MSAELTNHANLSLFVRIQPAKDQFLFCGECVLRNDARPVAAEHDSFGLLREHLAFHVAPDQQNCNFSRNSAAATPAFWRHSLPTLRLPRNLQDGTWISPSKSLIFVDALLFAPSRRSGAAGASAFLQRFRFWMAYDSGVVPAPDINPLSFAPDRGVSDANHCSPVGTTHSPDRKSGSLPSGCPPSCATGAYRKRKHPRRSCRFEYSLETE